MATFGDYDWSDEPTPEVRKVEGGYINGGCYPGAGEPMLADVMASDAHRLEQCRKVTADLHSLRAAYNTDMAKLGEDLHAQLDAAESEVSRLRGLIEANATHVLSCPMAVGRSKRRKCDCWLSRALGEGKP